MIDQLIAMYRRHPLLRAAFAALLICWAIAAALLVLDATNVITIPDSR